MNALAIDNALLPPLRPVTASHIAIVEGITIPFTLLADSDNRPLLLLHFASFKNQLETALIASLSLLAAFCV